MLREQLEEGWLAVIEGGAPEGCDKLHAIWWALEAPSSAFGILGFIPNYVDCVALRHDKEGKLGRDDLQGGKKKWVDVRPLPHLASATFNMRDSCWNCRGIQICAGFGYLRTVGPWEIPFQSHCKTPSKPSRHTLEGHPSTECQVLLQFSGKPEQK